MSTNSSPGPASAGGDSVALDQICQVLNTIDSCADVVEAITGIVDGTGRPYADVVPTVQAQVDWTRFGLPRARLIVNGGEVVSLEVGRGGRVCVRVTNQDPGRLLPIEVDGVVVTPLQDLLAAPRPRIHVRRVLRHI